MDCPFGLGVATGLQILQVECPERSLQIFGREGVRREWCDNINGVSHHLSFGFKCKYSPYSTCSSRALKVTVSLRFSMRLITSSHRCQVHIRGVIHVHVQEIWFSSECEESRCAAASFQPNVGEWLCHVFNPQLSSTSSAIQLIFDLQQSWSSS